jgi:general L-amino acid transport system permease protein
VLDTIRIFISVTILFLLFLYALVMFAQQGEGPASRGMSLLWLISIPIALWLLTGFSLSPDAVAAEQQAPLPPIDPSLIGGLLLTVLLSLVAIVISFPIGILLALGRQSNLPVIHLLCTVFIEVVRGVPLITLLFMGTFIVPFFGFGLGDVDLVIRIMVVLTLFTSAYMAEIVRGGLQIVPKGQFEAAYALGLNNFWTTTLIVLPQALRAVIPAIMGQAVSLFKDTTLVYLIGLFDITGVMYQILGDSQTGYLLYPREGFLYLGIIYFLISYMMADISRRVERTGAGAVRRETL